VQKVPTRTGTWITQDSHHAASSRTRQRRDERVSSAAARPSSSTAPVTSSACSWTLKGAFPMAIERAAQANISTSL
jgi:hypothetical protein